MGVLIGQCGVTSLGPVRVCPGLFKAGCSLKQTSSHPAVLTTMTDATGPCQMPSTYPGHMLGYPDCPHPANLVHTLQAPEGSKALGKGDSREGRGGAVTATSRGRIVRCPLTQQQIPLPWVPHLCSHQFMFPRGRGRERYTATL